MTKKRKVGQASIPAPSHGNKFGGEETFEDSEDEFYAGQDKILLEEEHAAKRRRKIEEHDHDLQPSDEEVFEEDGSDDETSVAREEATDEEDDEHEHWGTSRADYYNADVIETEADALEEEAEARRLQHKQLKSMTEADFGFDEVAWAAAGKEPEKGQRTTTIEKLPEVQVPDDATEEERMQILRSRYPEFEPLTKDFIDLQSRHKELIKKVERLNPATWQRGASSIPIVLTQSRALSAYLGAVSMYLAILTSSTSGLALAPAELRDHPIMNSLVRCRQLWLDARALGPDEDILNNVDPAALPSVFASQEQDPLEEVPHPANGAVSVPHTSAKRKSKKTLASEVPAPSKSQKDRQESSVEATKARPQSQKEKSAKRRDLQDLLANTINARAGDVTSDFGDEDPLSVEQAAEKARKKKSLRFYTSQIAQKANKRGAAARDAGGDDDVPHKERLRDKQARLLREAEKRGQAARPGKEDLDADDDDPEGDIMATASQKVGEEAIEYYDMLVANSKQKKAEKQARAEAYAEAAKHGAQVYEEEQIGPDGKRKITYAIEKNKGLAPKRKKEVRNPRVKKRKKFDEKMKKLGSIRPVYKGGEGRGGYSGELTGIKTNVVKSIKL